MQRGAVSLQRRGRRRRRKKRRMEKEAEANKKTTSDSRSYYIGNYDGLKITYK